MGGAGAGGACGLPARPARDGEEIGSRIRADTGRSAVFVREPRLFERPGADASAPSARATRTPASATTLYRLLGAIAPPTWRRLPPLLPLAGSSDQYLLRRGEALLRHGDAREKGLAVELAAGAGGHDWRVLAGRWPRGRDHLARRGRLAEAPALVRDRRRRRASASPRSTRSRSTIEKLVAGGDGLARVDGHPDLRAALGARRPRCGCGSSSGGRTTAAPRSSRCWRPAPAGASRPARTSPTAAAATCSTSRTTLQVRSRPRRCVETLSRARRRRAAAGDSRWSPARLGLPPAHAAPHRPRRAGRACRSATSRAAATTWCRCARCPILVPELEAQLPDAAGAPRRRAAAARLDLAAGDGGALYRGAAWSEALPHGEVPLAGRRLRLRLRRALLLPGATAGCWRRLVETAVGGWAGASRRSTSTPASACSRLPLARRYGRVVAVEGDRIAARYARGNARRNRLAHVEVVTAGGGELGRATCRADATAVVVDPPRAGLARAGAQGAARSAGRARLTYVSCHAATLARDLRELLRRYRLESLTLLDLFPQSGHMESGGAAGSGRGWSRGRRAR